MVARIKSATIPVTGRVAKKRNHPMTRRSDFLSSPLFKNHIPGYLLSGGCPLYTRDEHPDAVMLIAILHH